MVKAERSLQGEGREESRATIQRQNETRREGEESEAHRMKGYPVGDPRAKAAGRRGGSRSGERRGAAARFRWLARFPGVEPRTARMIWSMGYSAGARSKYQARKRSMAIDAGMSR